MDAETIPLYSKGTIEHGALYQTDDGTIFYHTAAGRIYVKHEGKVVEAKLPHDGMYKIGSRGNSVYLGFNETKIYKVDFVAPDRVTVTYLRDYVKDEKYFFFSTLFSRVRDGQKYLYFVDEDPHTDGMLVDVPKDKLQWEMQLLGIHRNKLIYAYRGEVGSFQVKHRNANSILVEMPPRLQGPRRMFARDSSPFLYIYMEDYALLFCVDTERMVHLPTLQFGMGLGMQIFIEGIHNDKICIMGQPGNTEFIEITGQLPDGYFKDVSLHIEDEPNEQTSKTVAELHQRISDLTLKMERIKTLNEEMLTFTIGVLEESKDLKQQVEMLYDALKKSEEKAIDNSCSKKKESLQSAMLETTSRSGDVCTPSAATEGKPGNGPGKGSKKPRKKGGKK